jgi:aconitate hydratase
MTELKTFGATVLANACGPCIGQWQRDEIKPGQRNTIVTSFNRNFPRRNDGNAETMAFIASPEIVTAYALSGKLSFNPLSDTLPGPSGEPIRLSAPQSAPDLPPNGFVRDVEGYLPPPTDGGSAAVHIDPASDRLQRLEPFDAWNGEDYAELPLLIKVQGKCTTDHISPAGPWLRYRGHLDNISNNMFTGAINAFSGKTGETRNLLKDAGDQSVPEVARAYKSAGLKWVVVGDENYGEGSSREHAAMSPRLLGAAAVITRSFARIHESNLKKQGVLPLVFADPADFDRVQATDRISVTGLAGLAPQSTVEIVLYHRDGSRERLPTRHSLNDEQVEWFKAGSALNVLRQQKA